MTRRAAKAAVVLVLLCCWSAFATPVLTLIPAGGALTGSANQTVGWGFTIVNNTTDWLLITNSLFCNTGGDPNFTNCTTPGTGPTFFGPRFGTYTDYIAARVTEVPPNTTIGPTAFSPGSPGFGVGQYKVNSSAPVGSMDVGNLFITYNEFIGDPFNGGTQDPNDHGNLELSATASVTVTAASGVPEPATFLLLGTALAGLAGLKRHRR